MSNVTLTAQELNARRQSNSGIVVLDVRLPEDYKRRHIAGALNNCVYEVAFLERLPDLPLSKDSMVCVYGESSTSHEAEVAAEKLKRAGYQNVSRLDGCLSGWCSAGLPVEGSGDPPEKVPVPHGRLEVDLQESRVEWLGRNLINKHWGRVPLTAGHLDFDQGELTGGELVLALTGITCDDLAGTPLHEVLVAHLRSDDFFDTDLHPDAKLVIRHAARIEGASPGGQNMNIQADLTLRGITAPVEFTAATGVDDKGRCAAQAAISIDRTRWGVLYGSGKFFHRLAGHLVNDLIELQVRIITA